jgi:hypothetical protein
MKHGMQKLPWWSANNGKQVLYPTKSMATPEVYHFFIFYKISRLSSPSRTLKFSPCLEVST